MTRTALFAFAVIALPYGTTAQTIDCANPQTQIDMTQCASNDYEAADARLNAAYGPAIAYMASIDADLDLADQGAEAALRDLHTTCEANRPQEIERHQLRHRMRHAQIGSDECRDHPEHEEENRRADRERGCVQLGRKGNDLSTRCARQHLTERVTQPRKTKHPAGNGVRGGFVEFEKEGEEGRVRRKC